MELRRGHCWNFRGEVVLMEMTAAGQVVRGGLSLDIFKG